MTSPDEILEFWYSEPVNRHWFTATPEIDQLIRDKYETLWREAAQGKLDVWANNADGCLALILLFDQFPLNMFRGKTESFSTEARAIQLALAGIEQEFDQLLPIHRLSFFYMPLMHSELLAHQNLAVEKFTDAGLKENARFARHHRDIIEQFGRFPHRNSILGRQSSPPEVEYLESEYAFKG